MLYVVYILLIRHFFGRYTSNGDYLTTDDLLLFLEAEQGVIKFKFCLNMHMCVMNSAQCDLCCGSFINHNLYNFLKSDWCSSYFIFH